MSDEHGGIKNKFIRSLRERDEDPEVQREFHENITRRYREAGKTALELPYSNGPVEGHATRLKQLRRAMYGRGLFDLVRKRFLATA